MPHYHLQNIKKFNEAMLTLEQEKPSCLDFTDISAGPDKSETDPTVFSYRIMTDINSTTKGLLCIKNNPIGTEECEMNGKIYEINKENPLIINAGEQYQMLSPSLERESFSRNFFWGKKSVNQVFLAHTLPLEKSINTDWNDCLKNFHFKNRINQGHATINYIIDMLEREANKYPFSDSEYLEEMMFVLLKTIFLAQNGLPDEIGDIRSLRASQKIEILKRLSIGRTYIDSCFREKIEITKVAHVSKLSKYHFIRLFKSSYGITPRQYLINKRMELARKLLKETDKTITEITMDTGLDNPSYFTHLFKNQFSITPSEFRDSLHQAPDI